ncbi:MAG: hypothetical protein J5711_01195 [Bacteroidales bacterium]|nr:hypothetical protein [Bacteroidales bacterium]
MKKGLLWLSLVLIIVSCDNFSRDEYEALQKENQALKEQVEELQNTPTNLLALGHELIANNRNDSAKVVLNKLIKKFPSSPEASEAEGIVNKIEKAEKEAREKAEKESKEKAEKEAQKRALGFKILKESTNITFDNNTANIKSISMGKRWVSDAYDDSWHYQDAEKDEIFVLTKLSITSKDKDPKLPPIGVYSYSNGKLVKLSEMSYRFSRWAGYGEYLGNYADYGNDFAHTSTISFSNAAAIKKSYQNEVIFVVMKKTGCLERHASILSNPPVGYVSNGSDMASNLTVDDFDSQYQVVKIFNKNKL